jgi:hypothetical protein
MLTVVCGSLLRQGMEEAVAVGIPTERSGARSDPVARMARRHEWKDGDKAKS